MATVQCIHIVHNYVQKQKKRFNKLSSAGVKHPLACDIYLPWSNRPNPTACRVTLPSFYTLSVTVFHFSKVWILDYLNQWHWNICVLPPSICFQSSIYLFHKYIFDKFSSWFDQGILKYDRQESSRASHQEYVKGRIKP